MGDMSLAKEMIAAASEAGADYAKFQTWSTEKLKQGAWDEDGRLEIYQTAELSVNSIMSCQIFVLPKVLNF